MFPSKSIHTDGIRAGVMVCTMVFFRRILLTAILVVLWIWSSWWNCARPSSPIPLWSLGTILLRAVQRTPPYSGFTIVQSYE